METSTRKKLAAPAATAATGVAAGLVGQAAQPGPEHKALEVIIGKWINQGHTIPQGADAAAEIHASDVYEWLPGKFFVLHTAYGRIGDIGVGGVELIGYDAERRQYVSYLFDSQGNITRDELQIKGNEWIWQGRQTGCTAVFSDHGKTQTAHHVRLDGSRWTPSMKTVLVKVS